MMVFFGGTRACQLMCALVLCGTRPGTLAIISSALSGGFHRNHLDTFLPRCSVARDSGAAQKSDATRIYHHNMFVVRWWDVLNDVSALFFYQPGLLVGSISDLEKKVMALCVRMCPRGDISSANLSKRFGDVHSALERILDGVEERPSTTIVEWDAIQSRKLLNSAKFSSLFSGGPCEGAPKEEPKSPRSRPETPLLAGKDAPPPPIPRRGSSRPSSPRPNTPAGSPRPSGLGKDETSPKSPSVAPLSGLSISNDSSRFESLDDSDLNLRKRVQESKSPRGDMSPRALLPPAPAPGVPLKDSLSSNMALQNNRVDPVKKDAASSVKGAASSGKIPTATFVAQKDRPPPPSDAPPPRVERTGTPTSVAPPLKASASTSLDFFTPAAPSMGVTSGPKILSRNSSGSLAQSGNDLRSSGSTRLQTSGSAAQSGNDLRSSGSLTRVQNSAFYNPVAPSMANVASPVLARSSTPTGDSPVLTKTTSVLSKVFTADVAQGPDSSAVPDSPQPPPFPSTWPSSTVPVEQGNAIQFVDSVYHFSKEKALSHFSSLCVLQVRVSTRLKMVFKIPSTLLRFVDEIHCNPNLRVYRDETTGAFTVDFAEAHEASTHVYELMRFTLKNKFPVDRVPLRLIPSVLSASQYLVTYEMNPVFENIAVLNLAVACHPLDPRAKIVGALCERGRTEKVVLEGGVHFDSGRKLLKCCVRNINKDARRDKLVFTVILEGPGEVRWGGVSCQFEVGKSLLPNTNIDLDVGASSKDIQVLGSKTICQRYYAV